MAYLLSQHNEPSVATVMNDDTRDPLPGIPSRYRVSPNLLQLLSTHFTYIFVYFFGLTFVY